MGARVVLLFLQKDNTPFAIFRRLPGAGAPVPDMGRLAGQPCARAGKSRPGHSRGGPVRIFTTLKDVC